MVAPFLGPECQGTRRLACRPKTVSHKSLARLVFGRRACPIVVSAYARMPCSERAIDKRIGLHHTHTHTHPPTLHQCCTAGQLRRPSDAITLAKSALLPADHVPIFPRPSPLPVRPSSGVRQPYSWFQEQHNPQSRLSARPWTLESSRVQLSPVQTPPAAAAAARQCNRHRPVWERPVAAHRRRTGTPARIVSEPSVNACMAIMRAHARGMLLLSVLMIRL